MVAVVRGAPILSHDGQQNHHHGHLHNYNNKPAMLQCTLQHRRFIVIVVKMTMVMIVLPVMA